MVWVVVSDHVPVLCPVKDGPGQMSGAHSIVTDHWWVVVRPTSRPRKEDEKRKKKKRKIRREHGPLRHQLNGAEDSSTSFHDQRQRLGSPEEKMLMTTEMTSNPLSGRSENKLTLL
jgi:hypothetical protein